MKRRILILGTGGTIACKRTEHGLAPALSSEELLSYLPEIQTFCQAETLQVCNEDSTNITPSRWLEIAAAIESRYSEFDGFVVCHGTDTMAYTAAALSYMIQNSQKPIVITGAQKPINMENTDAKTNLADSILYAADPESNGVHLVFDGKVIVGTRAKKVRAKSYNAFKSINFPYPATIQDGHVIRYLPSASYTEPVRFYHRISPRACVLKIIPGMDPALLSYVFEQYSCIVVESFGVGGIPSSISEEFYRRMRAPESARKLVVMATQVENEGSDMTVYEVGRKIKEDLNVLEAHDMTLEAVLTKIMWLMPQIDAGLLSREEAETLFYTEIQHDILFARHREPSFAAETNEESLSL